MCISAQEERLWLSAAAVCRCDVRVFSSVMLKTERRRGAETSAHMQQVPPREAHGTKIGPNAAKIQNSDSVPVPGYRRGVINECRMWP